MKFCKTNRFGKWFRGLVQNYNHEKYWHRRAIVTDPNNKTFILIKLYYLFYIKRTDAKLHCSFGTNLNSGAYFETPPNLPHGPSGIIVGHDLKIGRELTIYQQVTIANGGGKLGHNIILGAGAKVLSGFNIGNNAKIGANCVVIENIPDNATVVLPRPIIILH